MTHEYTLHYQPQWDTLTQQFIGAEALVRWNDPKRGLISPGQFIPEAEASGKIVDLTEWVLSTGCRQAKVWRDNGLQTKLAVNISPVLLTQGMLVTMVKQALEVTCLPPFCIQLEITESVAVSDNMSGAVQQLQALKTMGVSIALDDFGTGYSTLGCLLSLPIDQLKIDRTFVHGLDASESTENKRLIMMECVLDMAERLQLEVIVEGIETDRERKALEQIGCTKFQGYLFCHPLPAEQAWYALKNGRAG